MGNTQNLDVIPRRGLSAQEYLIDFLLFLKQRTGFNPEHFRANDGLNRTLSTLEYYRISKNLWIAVLNGCIRIISQFLNIANLTIEAFVEILIDVVNVMVDYVIDYFFLKVTLYLIGLFTPQYLHVIIRALYYFVTWAGRKIWQLVLPKIKSYSIFTLNQLSSSFEHRTN